MRARVCSSWVDASTSISSSASRSMRLRPMEDQRSAWSSSPAVSHTGPSRRSRRPRVATAGCRRPPPSPRPRGRPRAGRRRSSSGRRAWWVQPAGSAGAPPARPRCRRRGRTASPPPPGARPWWVRLRGGPRWPTPGRCPRPCGDRPGRGGRRARAGRRRSADHAPGDPSCPQGMVFWTVDLHRLPRTGSSRMRGQLCGVGRGWLVPLLCWCSPGARTRSRRTTPCRRLRRRRRRPRWSRWGRLISRCRMRRGSRPRPARRLWLVTTLIFLTTRRL